jgi:hypothetical protein
LGVLTLIVVVGLNQNSTLNGPPKLTVRLLAMRIRSSTPSKRKAWPTRPAA